MKLAVVVLLLIGSVAAAEPFDDHMSRARDLHDRGDFAGARTELLAAYAIDPRPALLFALGQIELNLGHLDAAIDYYERFLATSPAEEQATLAQQAIGAARMRKAQPAPQQPPPPPPAPVPGPPRWDLEDTGLAVLGGVALGVGSALVIHGRSISDDTSGTLAEYDARLRDARTEQWTGALTAGVGALAIAGAILHWRLEREAPIVTATAGGGGASIGVAGRW